jgi:hypothetical protein
VSKDRMAEMIRSLSSRRRHRVFSRRPPGQPARRRRCRPAPAASPPPASL